MKAKFLVPLLLFFGLAGFLAFGLTLNPREVPSPLIDKPAPNFRLARLDQPEQTFTLEDMRGQVWLLNVWASWCVACREEHPVLNALAARGVVPVIGLNYKDERADARRWLEQMRAVGVDQVIFIQQAGRNRHEDICSSLELFAAEVMPEFTAGEAERVARKQAELAPYAEAALARKQWMQPLADDEIPVVKASVARAQTSGSLA